MINVTISRSQRNYEIVMRYLDGEDTGSIASRFELTRQGVWYILHNDPEWDAEKWTARHKNEMRFRKTLDK